MRKTKKDVVIDAIFLTSIIVCLTLVLVCKGTATPTEAAHEPATAIVTEAAVEPTQEPTETELPATEATQPPVTLYAVPLDADLQLHIISEAEAHGIDPAVIFAMAFTESTYNPSCIGDNGNSFGLFYHLHRILNHGQGTKPQEVHFQKSQFF
jgi:hypothetical protein